MRIKLFNDIMTDIVEAVDLEQKLDQLLKGFEKEIQNLNKDIFLLLNNDKISKEVF